ERVGEPLLAVDGEIGDVADFAERLRQVIGGISVIFDDQETHDESTVSRIGGVSYGKRMLDCTNHSGTISSCPDLGPVRFPQARNVRGAASAPRPPSTNSAPAGRRMPERSRWLGTGFSPVPLVRTAGGGDGCRRCVPFSIRPCRAASRRSASRRPT